ncbi:hypothetical protein OROGR_012657 [Orobanche gracilis]
MASSNKHWPSMFKSKPKNHHHHPWQQHGINSSHISTGHHRNPLSPAVLSGCEEKSPEPKPRWNPRPEQIRILEAIFNSGMVNPPRDEIRKITFQLQEYGQVGDANVFYWFQNRKSRTKHKQRQSQSIHPTTNRPGPGPTLSVATLRTPSSSSSEKSSPDTSYYEKAPPAGSSNHPVIDDELLLDNNSLAAVPANHPLIFQAPACFSTEQPSFLPSISPGLSAEGFCFPDYGSVGNCPNVLLGDELMLMSNGTFKEKMEILQQQQQEFSNVVNPIVVSSSLSFSSPTNHAFQGACLWERPISPPKTTVFINDVCFEVAMRPLNVRETFGDDAVLFQSSGQRVLTNESGLTQQPLQNGAFYYLLRAFTPSLQAHDKTIALVTPKPSSIKEKNVVEPF